MMLRLLPFAATSLTCLAQTTWTVSPGSQLTTVQAAIAAAAAGDRIEVLGAGPYPAFVVDKGVDIEAMTGATCASFEVFAVPNAETARVAGFVVDRVNSGFVRVRDCPGAVQLANIGQLVGTTYGFSPGLEISNSANVFVRGGVFYGGGTYGFGCPGIRIDVSRVVLVGTTARGGSALPVGGMPVSGWPGIFVNGFVTMVGVSATGGTASAVTGWGGSGGHGIEGYGGTTLVLGACTLQGMPGAPGYWGPSPLGLAASGNVQFTPDTVLIGGTPAAMAIAARPIVNAPQTALVGTTLVVGVQGSPNQPVWLGLDLRHDYTLLPALASALCLTSTAVMLPSITLDAFGAGSLLVPIPNHPAARNRNVFVQAAAFAGGALVLGAPSSSRTQ